MVASRLVYLILIIHALFINTMYGQTYCATGSRISSLVDGSYEYEYTNELGAVYFNEDKDQYLFPYESGSFKQYIISDDPSVSIPNSFIADSISTIQSDAAEYSFEIEDFSQNWQSFTSQNLLIHDTEMRLTQCHPICIESGSYKGAYFWKEYDLATESSVYHNDMNGMRLYRSNITANNQNWQIFDNSGFIPISEQNTLISSCNGLYIVYIIAHKQKTNKHTESMEIDSSNSIKVTANYDDKHGNLMWIIPSSIAFAVMFAAVIVVIRAYKFEQDQLKRLQSNSEATNASSKSKKLEKRPSVSQLPPPMPRRPSQIHQKQIEIKIEGDTPRGSFGSSNGRRSTAHTYSQGLSTQLALEALDSQFDFSRKMSAQSVASVSPRCATPNSKKLSVLSPSHRKYSDIMPPTRPPPLGMKRVLSADQKAKRPLPPTPKASDNDSAYVD